MNVEYHYPPELFQLLVDTIPRLCRSKRDVVLFLRGAGVKHAMLSGIEIQLANDRESINKFGIVRTVLSSLNEIGDSGIRQRREVVKRVVEFEDFSTCWPDDELEAKGLVAEIRRVVNVKDSFTRINLERDAQVRKHRETQEAEADALRRHRERIGSIRQDLYNLFTMNDAQKRGASLEKVLNDLFDAAGVLVREDFRRVSELGQGVIEQIDGIIEFEGQIYLVEMKWLKERVGAGDVAQHLVRVFTRNSSRGIFISYSDYTASAIEMCKESLGKAVVVLCTLEEFVFLLEREASLEDFLRTKIQHSIIDKQPFVKVL